jgi:hypothetical protein
MMHYCVVILVVGIIMENCFYEKTAHTLKKGYKNWGPKILAFLSL